MICPLLSARGGNFIENCLGNKCAMWDNEQNCCSIISITKALDNIEIALQELNSK